MQQKEKRQIKIPKQIGDHKQRSESEEEVRKRRIPPDSLEVVKTHYLGAAGSALLSLCSSSMVSSASSPSSPPWNMSWVHLGLAPPLR